MFIYNKTDDGNDITVELAKAVVIEIIAKNYPIDDANGSLGNLIEAELFDMCKSDDLDWWQFDAIKMEIVQMLTVLSSVKIPI